MFSNIVLEGPKINQEVRVVPNSLKITELAKEYFTQTTSDEPFFLCNLGEVVRKYSEWMEAFPRIKPFYAVKCNDDEVVIRLLAGLGTGFDCASQSEINQVIGLGVDGSQIIFANPAKLPSHIKTAKKHNVTMTTVDNVYELMKIKTLHPTARLLLRMRSDADRAGVLLGRKYGALLSDVPELFAKANDLGLQFNGVSFHVGSNCFDPPAYRRAIALAKDVCTIGYNFGFNMKVVDIGGGFCGYTESSLTEVSNLINGAIDDYFPEGSDVEFIAEPGRFFVTSAFYSLTQVHSKRKVTDDKGQQSFMYFVTDGVFSNFSEVIFREGPPRIPMIFRGNHEVHGPLFPCSLWGPTCDSVDQIFDEKLLPELEIGDWLLFKDMGAYSRTIAGTFNGFPISKTYHFITEDVWNTVGSLTVTQD